MYLKVLGKAIKSTLINILLFSKQCVLFKFIFPNKKAYNFASLSLSVTYDTPFLNNVCEGDHECAVNKVDTIITIAETYFQAPEKLGTKIDLDIKEIKYTDTVLRLRYDGPCDYERAL